MSLNGMRSHQKAMDRLASNVIANSFPKNSITLDCTPGGGKTGSATLLANRLLDAGVIDSVLWLVPRISLAEQVMDAFATGFGSHPHRRLMVGHDDLFPTTFPDMPPAIVGNVTTYQSVATRSKWRVFREAVAARRTLMIFDEVQFLNDDAGQEDRRGWCEKVSKVKEAAKFSLLMSGTLWRTDNKRIPFVEYERRADGLHYPLWDISYTLRQAVAERAVLPVECRNRSGSVEYIYNGDKHVHDLLDDSSEEESRKIRAFLSNEKAVGSLLDRMVDDWREWCRRVYQSRMIVMAEDIRQARRWQQLLQKRHDISCVLATSKEEAAGRKLRHFRERRAGQCLVTVAMAYVGFDCPDLTHLAYLTHYRAPSWMLQSFARVSRYDRNAPVDYDHQHAFIYAPDDEPMRQFCSWVRNQVEIGVRDRFARAPSERASPAVAMPDDFEPVGAEPGGLSVESLHRRLDPDIVEFLDAFARNNPIAADLPRSKLYELLTSYDNLGLHLSQLRTGVLP